MTDPFAPAGDVSIRVAVLSVFREMQPGDWVARDELVHRVEEQTGLPALETTVRSAAWKAREELAKKREASIEFQHGGYKRLTADGQVDAALRRRDRVKRAVKRTVNWAGAALANPEVTGPARQQMQQLQWIQLRQTELEERRASKRRPKALPPGGAG